jgi:hypothetical protein
MRAYPRCDFQILEGRVIYNNVPDQVGPRNTDVRNVDTNLGYISLYEFNIDRPYAATNKIVGEDPNISYTAKVAEMDAAGEPVSFMEDKGIIQPWISKDSARASFKTVGKTSYNNEFAYGQILSAVYPFSASISREYVTTPYASTSSYNAHYVALRNTLNFYGLRSDHYKVTSSHGNKNTQTLNLMSVPSIFYGTRIKPGSLSLKWYYTSSLAGELQDTRQNGELIQVGPVGSTGSGSIGGVVLYDEGIILLTGSWALNAESVTLDGSSQNPSWIHYGVGANDGASPTANVSFDLSFQGSTDTQVMTVLAQAKRGEVNYSTNPTFLQYGQDKTFFTSSNIYEENSNLLLKNFVSSSYSDYSASFKRQVYVSRIGIYDENKNLIAVATLADPVLKREDEDISFKLTLDI